MSDGKDIHKMTRAELDDYAGGLGIANAAELANKDEVIAAIDAATAEQDAAPDDDAPADDDDAAGDAPEQSGQRYTVLKAVTDEAGRTYMPGEEFAFSDAFPARRRTQLVDQKFLRPID